MTIFNSGPELKKYRSEIGLSQAKLAKITGITQAKISSFELEKSKLSLDEIKIIKNTINQLDSNTISKLKKKKYKQPSHTGKILASRPRRSYEKTARNEEYLETLKELESDFQRLLSANAPKALSFFAGAGGLCYGIKAAGFQLIGAAELHQGFRKIHNLNFPSSLELVHDVRKFSQDDCKKVIDKEGEIDLMIGGPPCQGFSLTGKRDVNDKRNSLFEDYLKIANVVNPKIILMENVRLLTSMKDPNGHLVSERILSEFLEIGYKVDFFFVNAKNYGVPQHRERVIFVATRAKNQLPSIPPITHDISADLFSTTKPFFTFGDAVSDLEYIESGEKSKTDKYHQAVSHPEHVLRWLVDVPEGHSAHENEDPNMRPPSGYNTTYKRQVWGEPGATVSTNFSMISGSRNIHPIATRSITIREAMRLQSFPDSFRLTGTQSDIRASIGNAVPPLLAYALGKHLIKTYM